LILSEQKFPECTGTPVARLRKLNEMTKQFGWKGTGFWVSAKPFEYGKNGNKQSLQETKNILSKGLSGLMKQELNIGK